MYLMELIKSPWPWYVSGPLIGLTVPTLLLIGNKSFGISSNLRHICAACFPGKIEFFKYDWKKEYWNLFFALGIILGGCIVTLYLQNPDPLIVKETTKAYLHNFGITHTNELLPSEIFSFEGLLTLRGFILIIIGGFLVGFGTRYAGGCTSGHAIMGLSNLQWPSLVATICFMIGGIICTWLILPLLLNL